MAIGESAGVAAYLAYKNKTSVQDVDYPELKNKLFRNVKSGWENLSNDEMDKIFEFSNGYISFLNEVKTE